MNSLVNDVLAKLEPLVSQQLKLSLRKELESLFKDAANLWLIAQKDRNLIEIDSGPNPDDDQGWMEDSTLKSYTPELEDPGPKLVKSNHVVTFPKVVRYAFHKDPTTGGGKIKGLSSALVIHKGSAIFSNSIILREAIKEWEGQDQDMRDASFKATTKARSPVMTLHQEPTLLRDRIQNKRGASREPLPNGTQSVFD
jgi:hypothetical protein